MTSQLSAIPAAKRRQLAATLGLFGMLFLAVGAVAATGADTAVTKAFVVIALVVAILLSLMAWGVLHSVKLDAADKRLDDVIAAAVRAHGRTLCDCGHEHDPDELHFTDGPGQHVTGAKCAHDGRGVDCAHSCATCVLAAMRPIPAAPRPGPGRHRRPSPIPR